MINTSLWLLKSNMNLLNVELLSYVHNELIDLVLIRKRLGNTVFLQAPLGPSNKLGALTLYVEAAKSLEPSVEWNKCYIHKT